MQVDLEDEAGLATVEATIAGINPAARRIRTRHSAVDVADILDIRALAGDRCPPPQSLAGTDALLRQSSLSAADGGL